MYNLTPRPKVVTLPHGASKLPQAGKTAACASRGFFVPEIAQLWPGGLGNTTPVREIPRAVLVTVSNLLTTTLNFEKTQGETMKNRTLKVCSGYYDHTIKGEHAYYVPPPVPFVLIKGYWLEKVNFDIGKIVNVELKENQLILTTEPS